MGSEKQGGGKGKAGAAAAAAATSTECSSPSSSSRGPLGPPTSPPPAVDVRGACLSEHWEAIRGIEALFPEEYAAMPLEELAQLVKKEVAAVTNTKLGPKERCRLAHVLGHFSATEKGDQLFARLSAHKAFFALVEEFSNCYAAGRPVTRPCVVGFSMLALSNLIKQEVARSQQQQEDMELPTAEYILHGLPAGDDPRRLVCVWTLLKCMVQLSDSSSEHRSRSMVRAVSHNLELLSVLERCQIMRGGGSAPSLLSKVKEPDLNQARFQVLRAASLVLRHSGSASEVCGSAKALDLFEVARAPGDLLARGGPAWRLFSKAGGVSVIARALPPPPGSVPAASLSPSCRPSSSSSTTAATPPNSSLLSHADSAGGVGPPPSSSSSAAAGGRPAGGGGPSAAEWVELRLSVLSFLSDLGPDHSLLVLPAVDLLVKWAAVEDAAYEPERRLSLLSLAKLVRGGDMADVAFLHELGFLAPAVRRLHAYHALMRADAAGLCGRHGELVCVSTELVFSLVALSPAAVREMLAKHRPVVDVVADLLARLGSAPDGIRVRLVHVVTGALLGLVEEDSTVLRQMRQTKGAAGALKQLLMLGVTSSSVLALLLRLLTLCLLLEPEPSDAKELYGQGAVLPVAHAAVSASLASVVNCASSSSSAKKTNKKKQQGSSSSEAAGGGGGVVLDDELTLVESLDSGLHYLVCAVVMRERRMDLVEVQAAYRRGGSSGLARFLDALDLHKLIHGNSTKPPQQKQQQTAGSSTSSSRGEASFRAAVGLFDLASSTTPPTQPATAAPPRPPPSSSSASSSARNGSGGKAGSGGKPSKAGAATKPTTSSSKAAPSQAPRTTSGSSSTAPSTKASTGSSTSKGATPLGSTASAPPPSSSTTASSSSKAPAAAAAGLPPQPGVVVTSENCCRVCRKGPETGGVSLLRCSRCKAVRYCSRECQLTHWKAGHRKECVLAAKQ